MSLEPKDTPQGTVGAAFANALVAGKYEVASNLLSASLQAELSPMQLKEKFESMCIRKINFYTGNSQNSHSFMTF